MERAVEGIRDSLPETAPTGGRWLEGFEPPLRGLISQAARGACRRGARRPGDVQLIVAAGFRRRLMLPWIDAARARDYRRVLEALRSRRAEALEYFAAVLAAEARRTRR